MNQKKKTIGVQKKESWARMEFTEKAQGRSRKQRIDNDLGEQEKIRFNKYIKTRQEY